MANDSTSGGPLLPIAGGPAPLEGQALGDFFQQWIAGITGMPGDMVRPRFQGEAPNIPNAGTAWAAFGLKVRPADEYPYVVHNGAWNGGQGCDELHQHEEIEILCSFYDLGTRQEADANAALLRQGLAIDQNLELLTLNNMGLVVCGAPIPLPGLLKTRWNYRVDMQVEIKREIIRYYPVGNVDEIDITLIAEGSGPPDIIRTIVLP